MKSRSFTAETAFLQAVLVLIGIGAVAFLLGEPHFEGRNAQATPYEIYFHDPFLAYAYIASIPFFVGLFQAFQALGYARRNEIRSQAVLKALRTIRACAIAMIGFVVVGEVCILLPNADEPPQAIAMGLLVAFGSAVIAAAASLFERVLRSATSVDAED